MKNNILYFLLVIFVATGSLLAVTPAYAEAPEPPALFSPAMSNRIVHYEIEVKLLPEGHKLIGKEIIHWRNTTSDTVTNAYFHLYMNAFANDHTVFATESSGRHRGFSTKGDRWGYCLVESIKQVSEDGNLINLDQSFPGRDKTVMTVKLPTPVKPGNEAVFSISFEILLPKIFARTGYAGDFVMAGQWFPKLGVYQEGKGWNCHTFHLNSEFFADFGVYDVSITVPGNYIVGATGIKWKESSAKGTKRVDYHAEDVHDFAWTASPDLIDLNDTWENVKIRVLMQPENRSQSQRYFKAVKTALAWFKVHMMKYPYQMITIVDAPYNGMGAGGMEYPTLITGMASPFIPSEFLIPEITVVHEFGHQYWYGMSANNEFEEAWLDEGINSYCEKRIMDEWYGDNNSVINGLAGIHFGDSEQHRAGYAQLPDLDPIEQNSWEYASNGSYSVISYDKSSMVLTTLEGMLGRKEMDRIMKGFFNSVKFTHTTTDDFMNYFCRESGESFRPMLNDMIYGTGTIDFAVSSVRTKKIEPPKGYDLDKNPPAEYPGHLKDRKDKDKQAGSGYESTVRVTRKGTLVLPVDIRTTFKDGKVVLEHWNGEKKYIIYRYRGAKISRVEIDPENLVTLDLDRSNNGWMRKPDKLPARTLTTRFRLLEQAIFQALSLLL